MDWLPSLGDGSEADYLSLSGGQEDSLAAPNSPPLGIGYYSAADAEHLIGVPARRIRRWLLGYRFTSRAEPHFSPPLWRPQLPSVGTHLELGFRDLMELRFVDAFTKAGLSLLTIRSCIQTARELAGDERPFSTATFRTDGQRVFLQVLDETGEPELLDLAKRQYEFNRVVEPSFKDIHLADGVPVHWWPQASKRTIVVDPKRQFGQPILVDYGVPTAILRDAVLVEGSIKRAAEVFEVPAKLVQDALRFERRLAH